MFCITSRVRAAIVSTEPFFRESYNATGIQSATTDLKTGAALWKLRYGQASDKVPILVPLSESCTHECRPTFVAAVIKFFEKEDL